MKGLSDAERSALQDGIEALPEPDKTYEKRRLEQALDSDDPLAEVQSRLCHLRLQMYERDAKEHYVSDDGGVTPHFKMLGSGGLTRRHANQDDFKKAVGKLSPEDEARYNRVQQGKGSPDDVARLTHRLIDSGALEEEKNYYNGRAHSTDGSGPSDMPRTWYPLSNHDAVRMLMWDYGLGIDCSGYVWHAIPAAHGGTPSQYHLNDATNENFTTSGWRSGFREVVSGGNGSHLASEVGKVRPGDVFVLGRPQGEAAGHVAIVNDHEVLSPDDARARFGGSNVDYLHGSHAFEPHGEVHVLKVDSSWGAGSNADPISGGVGQRTWIFDGGAPEADRWIQVRPANPPTNQDQKSLPGLQPDAHERLLGSEQPYNHPLIGVFRPKSGM